MYELSSTKKEKITTYIFNKTVHSIDPQFAREVGKRCYDEQANRSRNNPYPIICKGKIKHPLRHDTADQIKARRDESLQRRSRTLGLVVGTAKVLSFIKPSK